MELVISYYGQNKGGYFVGLNNKPVSLKNALIFSTLKEAENKKSEIQSIWGSSPEIIKL